MRYLVFITLLVIVSLTIGFSCKKWKDPAPVDDPRLTRPYCNDPDAVNYNWDFPGKPDSTVCFYPTDIFRGVYLCYDSVYKDDTLFIRADSFLMTINNSSTDPTKKMEVFGFCPSGNFLKLTASPSYEATVDTTVGDSLTVNLGQLFCRVQDTVTGMIFIDRIDSALLHIELQVFSDTGVTRHIGSARKK